MAEFTVKFVKFIKRFAGRQSRICHPLLEGEEGFFNGTSPLWMLTFKAGRFTEIVPVPCRSRPGISKAEAPKEMHTTDEGIRPKTNLEQLAKLKPILQNGVLTAAAASQICDGASAVHSNLLFMAHLSREVNGT